MPVSLTYSLPFQYIMVAEEGAERIAWLWWMMVDVIWFSFEPEHRNLLRLINLSVCFHLAVVHSPFGESKKSSEATYTQDILHKTDV